MPSLEALAEALSAAEGGAISTAVLYPLEVIKTVIQAQQTSTKKKPKKRTAASGEEKETEGEGRGGSDEAAGTTDKTAVLVAVGAAVATASASSSPGATDAEEGEEGEGELTLRKVVEDVYARSGLRGFFEGVEYASLQSAIEKAVYFYAYSVMKGITKLLTGGTFAVRENLVVGYLAEIVHLPVTVPLEVVITRIITSKGRVTSLTQAAQEAIKESGIAGLYKGISAYGVLCLKPAIQYTVFEQLRKGILAVLTRRQGGVPVKALTALQAFLLGALSRAIATVVLFPWIRVRKQLMAQQKQQAQPQPQAAGEGAAAAVAATAASKPTVLGMLKQTLENEGAPALFRGMGPELARGVLSAALMLMIKERLYSFNRGLLRQRGGMPKAYA